MCPPLVSGVNDNYKEFGKRKFPNIADKNSGLDFEPKFDKDQGHRTKVKDIEEQRGSS